MLGLAKNNLSDLPSTIGNLSGLLALDVEENQFTVFPSVICDLHNLSDLRIRENQITSLPSNIRDLIRLELLNVQENQLSKLPPEIQYLSSLTTLDLTGNVITNLPSEFSNLANLSNLRLGGNEFENIPSEINSLPNLTYLSFNGNKIIELPVLTTHPNVLNLLLDVRYNHIPVNDIAQNLTGNGTYNFHYFFYDSQSEIFGNPDTVSVEADGYIELEAVTNIHPQTEFQWQRLVNANWVDMQGYNIEVYPINEASTLDTGQYRCRVTNDWVSGITQYSAPITLEIEMNEGEVPDALEYAALAAFYNAIGAEEWGGANWLQGETSADFASWYGITVENGDVVTINIRASNATGALPSEIGNLSKLRNLMLDYNGISSIPPEIGFLSDLEVLTLEGNQLNQLPNEIGNLSSMLGLSVYDNHISSIPSSIGNLMDLKSLNLAYNQLSELPSEISQLKSLNTLDLSSNQLEVISDEIANFPKLRYLDLYGNQLKSFPDFSGLPLASNAGIYVPVNQIHLNDIAHNLSGLNTSPIMDFQYYNQSETIGEAQIVYAAAGAIATLHAFTNHHPQSYYLWQRLVENTWTDIAPETQNIAFTVANLTTADAGQYRCRITNDWVQQWGQPMIQYSEPITLVVEGSLDAQTQALHDYVNSMASPTARPTSWNLSNPIDTWEGVLMENGLVTEVVLREVAVQGSIPATFADLTQLRVLDLTATGLQAPLPSLLNDLTQLEMLALGGNALNIALPTLNQLTNLHTLNLSGNNLTGSLPAWISNLDQLQELRLGANQLSGSIPGTALSQLEKLRVLDLHSNQFTDTIPPFLASTSWLLINFRLQEVDLSNNQLTGGVPTFFHLAWALEKLNLQDNNLSYLPDLSGHHNADSLNLQVDGNQLPLADIANNHAGPDAYLYQTFTYASQSVVDTVFVTGEVATLGRDVALRVDLKEHPQHQYEWEQKTADGNWTPVAGANERSYVIRDATPADTEKEYRVKITNAFATLANARSAARDLVAEDFRRYVRSYTPREEFSLASNVDTTTIVDDVSITTSYIDGFGRTVQTVVRGGGGAENQDLVQFNHYDALGRTETAFLPYATPNATGSYRPDAQQQQASFYQEANNAVANSSYPFSEVRYETSPLSRVLEQGAPGAVWQLGGHTATQDYRANTEADAVAKLTVDSFDSIRYLNFPVGGSYPVGKLHVAETTDENGHYVQEFSNLEGQLVLKRVQGPNGNLDTYSVYDHSGRLRFVIPPQAVAEMDANWSKTNSLTFRERWMFIYYYDSYGRASAEHTPGGGINKMIYDRWGRLVYSQNAAMRVQNPNQWSFTKYDYLDRPIMSGVYTAGQDEASLRQQVATTSDRHETTSASGVGYTLNQSWPHVTEADVRTVSYYDNYSFPHATQSDMTFTSDIGGQTPLTNMKGELTGSLTRNLSDQTWLRSMIYYDAQYRPIVAITDNHLGGIDRTTTKYASVVLDEVVETITKHITASDDHTIRQTYDYDHQSRPTEVTHKVDTESTVTLASYTYNALGQLVQKQLNDNAPTTQATQTVNYRYHIRGWLSSINDLNDADAYYAQLLNYQTQGQYNGNIAQVQWKNQGEGAKSYDYSYDAADRLTGATFQQQVSGSWAAGNFSVSGITYDGNGNLLTLQRQGEVNNAATTLDHLQYAYQGNRLASVQEQTGGSAQFGFVDNPTPSGDEYGYDAAGNLVRDDNKGITNITYDPVLNLPLEVSMTNGTLRYTYDAAGIKLSQTLLDSLGTEVRTTHYDGPFEYDGNRLSLIHHGEGRVYYNQDSSHQAYHFDMKDHLGNVRVTFSSVPVVLRQMLTMETTAAPEEEILFEGVSAHRQTLAFHNTTEASQLAPSPNKVATLLPGQQGIGKSLRVQAGDKVTLQVEARYETRPTSVQGLEGVVTELARAAQGTATGLEAVGAVESLNGAALGGALAKGKEAQPEAYLNYLVFDENHQLISEGFQSVSDAAAVGPDQPDAAPETLWAEVPIQEAGYLYTYLSNEQGSGMPVFFDDFSVVHQSHIVQVNDYYPFGATHDQEGYVGDHNKYGYQGKELQADLGLNLMDFHARQYDPLLGRFMSYDPAGQFASGYTGMGNNPIATIDPDGRVAMLPFLLVGAALMYNTYQSAQAGATGLQWIGTSAVTIAASAAGPGVIQGAIAGGANSAIMGQDIGRGALFGGISGGVNNLVNVNGILPGALTGAAIDGLLGGIETAIYDGNFGSGFKQGLISGAIQGGIFGGIRAAKDPFGRNLISGGLTEQGKISYAAYLIKNAMPSPQLYASNGGGEPTYSYNGKEGLTYYQLYTEILIDQAATQFGIKDIAALAAVVSGQPIIPKRFVTPGSSPGTSLASKTLSKIPGKSPVRLPTLIANSSGIRIAFTKSIGRFLGRAVPVVGWGILTYDVGMTLYNTQVEFDRITNGR